MAASPVLSTFNGGQVLLNPIAGDSSSQNAAAATAVQSDGKLVVVGSTTQLGTSAPTAPPTLTIRRYNPDGTLDTTFGTGGEATTTLAASQASLYNLIAPASRVLIDSDGNITVAASLFQRRTNAPISFQSVPEGTAVVRFTKDGTLDTTFGTGGEVDLLAGAPDYSQVAFQDGKILLAGEVGEASSSIIGIVVTRLDADGSVDPSFNGGNVVIFSQAPVGSQVLTPNSIAGLGVTPDGRVDVIYAATAPTGLTAPTFISTYIIAALDNAGALDGTYGTGGFAVGPAGVAPLLATVATDGQVVLATPGTTPESAALVRVGADGTLAPFATQPAFAFRPESLLVAADGSIVAAGAKNTSTILVARFAAGGTPATAFGPGGVARLTLPALTVADPPVRSEDFQLLTATGLTLTNDGRVVVAGTQTDVRRSFSFPLYQTTLASRSVVAVLAAATPGAGFNGDYDGDNKSDLAAELTTLGLFAYRTSTGTGDVVQPFGVTDFERTVPAPGDYDGDGKTDVAGYLPFLGVLAYRASSGTGDHLVRFGPTGFLAAVPVPGDYDGDGKTDVALFVPSEALYLIEPSGGGAPYAVQFGAAGAGQSIPVPGDYDGDGKTDLAVYVPEVGALFFRSSAGAYDAQIAFGPPGLNASVPVAGDFDGDGRADVAVFLPSTSTFAIDPSGGGAPYAVQFGDAGDGRSTPVRGDFDGDGKDDLAVFMSSVGSFAYRPSSGGADVIVPFGTNDGATTPASSLPPVVPRPLLLSLPATRGVDPLAGLVFFLPEDMPGTTPRKNPSA